MIKKHTERSLPYCLGGLKKGFPKRYWMSRSLKDEEGFTSWTRLGKASEMAVVMFVDGKAPLGSEQTCQQCVSLQKAVVSS